MKNCINCQNLIEDTTKFCPECGTKQPDLPKPNQNSTNSASIGDKNVISGNVIGKNEEYNITGNATINKIEDETKKFITCAVSGKHLLRGRDIVVSCPKCKSDVAQECFNMAASRCFNCDKKAYAQYSEKLDSNLADGMIDAMERIQLDAFALSLLIDSSTKYRLETEAKERKASANLNFSGANSSDLSGFYKIQFKKATELIYNKNDLAGAISLLSSIHKENIFHGETACLYFLIKAIYTPNQYIEEYDKEDHRAIDVYWKHYWAFVPYLKLLNFDKGFKIINLNKARFSENHNDILLSEVLAFLLLFTNSKEADYIAEAKSLFVAINKTLNLSLIPLNDLINKLLYSPDAEWETIAQDFNLLDRFYYQYILGGKQGAEAYFISGNSKAELNDHTGTSSDFSKAKGTSQSESTSIESDENGNSWIDEPSGLRVRENQLYFFDKRTGIEYKTLLTNREIWLAKNLEITDNWWESIFEDHTHSFEDYIPENWFLPSIIDWKYFDAYISQKNGINPPVNINAIQINNTNCYIGDLLVCIDAGDSSVLKTGNEYILVNHYDNLVYLYDYTNKEYLYQSETFKLLPNGKRKFKLKESWFSKMTYIAQESHMDANEFPYIHPKYLVANKFGIDYNRNWYLTFVPWFEGYFHNEENYGGLEIRKQYGGAFYHSKPENIRILLPYSKNIIENLVQINFKLPDYLKFEDILISNIVSSEKSEYINKEKLDFKYEMETENLDTINMGDWIICNNAFNFNYEGNMQTMANGQLYKVNGFKEKSQQVSFEEYPQLNKTNSKTWLPASNFMKLDKMPKINILEIEKGKQLICVSNEYFDNGDNYLISVSGKYIVDTINTNKNNITLMEFPQKNKAEKLKWFSIDNFRILH
jgi:hypothetical protein